MSSPLTFFREKFTCLKLGFFHYFCLPTRNSSSEKQPINLQFLFKKKKKASEQDKFQFIPPLVYPDCVHFSMILL